MANDPRPMVLMTTHRVVKIGDQSVTERVNEWVRADDPRLPREGDARFECGPVSVDELAKESPPPTANTVDEPITATTPATATVAIAPQKLCTEDSALNIGVPKREPRREVCMAAHEMDEEVYEEEGEQEEDDDDRPWKITRQTLADIDCMSPSDLEAVIDNINDYERWDDLRETARRLTAQRLSAAKKAKAAPRCEFVKVNGEKCGSPAMKGEATCYNHGQAHAKRQAEEAAKILDAPILDTRVSVQVAITRVCSLLATGSIDDKRARALISALQLAHRNIGEGDSIYSTP